MCRKTIKAKNGISYTLITSNEGDEITIEHLGKKIGHISLDYIPEEYKRPGDYYYITDLAMSDCKGIGIGEAALRFHKEIFNAPIVAAPEHGLKMHDGSHLIDDGVPFIRRMREKGIVCPEPSEQEDY